MEFKQKAVQNTALGYCFFAALYLKWNISWEMFCGTSDLDWKFREKYYLYCA